MKQPLITTAILCTAVFIPACNWQGRPEMPQVQSQVAVVPPTNFWEAVTGSARDQPAVVKGRPKPFWPHQVVYGMNYEPRLNKSNQIAEYVRRIFEDSRGNMWFGTNGLGVCRYDGKKLMYFSPSNGLSGLQVTGIIEDRQGNIWFSTTGGISMYNGKIFTSFTREQGLSSNAVWSIYEDSRGVIWAGTARGLCMYRPGEGGGFSAFRLPEADVSNPQPRFSTKLVSSIMEDKAGNLWFGTDGVGVVIYNPAAEKAAANQFTHLSREDGLCDNSIVSMLQDREGNIWLSSRFGGLSKYNPTNDTAGKKGFTNFTVEGGDIGNNEVWTIYEDSAGNIWFSSEGYGIYRHTNKQLTHFGKKEGLPAHAVQSIFEDKKGQLWIGSGNGLYIFDGTKFRAFTRESAGQGC